MVELTIKLIKCVLMTYREGGSTFISCRGIQHIMWATWRFTENNTEPGSMQRDLRIMKK